MGTVGRPLPRRARRDHPGQGPAAPQSHGWTPAPANGSPSCRSWSAAPPSSTPTRPRCCKRPAPPGPATSSPPPGRPWPAPPARRRQRLGRRPGRRHRRDLTTEEDRAFWAWAAIEVLRATGVRVEELVELSHHSLVHTGCPALASWCRCCRSPRPRPTPSGSWSSAPNSPTCSAPSSPHPRRRPGRPPGPAYDGHERLWRPPAPVLFQRRFRAENRSDPRQPSSRKLARPRPSPAPA